MGVLERKAEVLYLECRKELDKICVPEIIKCCEIIPIGKDAEMGIMCVAHQEWWEYIDCLYIRPEYRRQGIAKKTVLEWYKKQENPVRLHIINNNKPALEFWNSIFELLEMESNDIDTLYCIKKVK